jgi:glycogen debranching enzyme
MPTLQPTKEAETVCVPTKDLAVEELLGKEWLLTNERGSYCSSTIVGCNTSGYHGLLIGAPEPLVNRVMALSNCLERVLWDGQALELSTFEFPGGLAPTGYTYLREFRRDMGSRFLFHLEPVDLCKAIYLARDSDTVVVEYRFEEVRAPVDFTLRPLLGLRDFHTLQTSRAPLVCESADDVLRVRHGERPGCELSLSCLSLTFQSDPQWWFNFLYRANRERGLNCLEDLWAPGFFRGHIERPRRIVFWARLTDGNLPGGSEPPDLDAIKRDLLDHRTALLRRSEACRDGRSSGPAQVLCVAADQFVVKRRSVVSAEIRCPPPCHCERSAATAIRQHWTIVAGYPWFADWGRDTFISLPGLLLTTGGYDEAGSVLRTFAAAVDEGMVPNHFDDRTGKPHFNSVDASLWFIHAAFEYLDATGDTEMFLRELVPAVTSILDAYRRGTRFGIHADADGLITAGDENTQLTWMDAKYDGIAITPRYGKAVEVNALWHNALRRMEKLPAEIRNPKSEIRYAHYGALAEQVGRSFCDLFWNEQRGYLNDVILPDGSVDTSLRPNQIFAVSLPYGPPLTHEQRQGIVKVVERELLTPYGLRTLSRQDISYRGRYEGSPRCRDEAYHQGTVWPYLIGPFIEAYLKVHDFSPHAKDRAADLLRPLLHHLTKSACLGSISEIFDGDPPYKPRGCSAQAWSVAELIRAYRWLTTD